MSFITAVRRQLAVTFDRIGEALDPAGLPLDRGALGIAVTALAAATITFFLVPADPTRLARFSTEHVQIFGMADSTPQRLAFVVFLAVLLLGVVALRFFDRSPSAIYLGPTSSRLRRILVLAVTIMLVVNVAALGHGWFHLDPWAMAALLVYSAATAVFIWNRSLPPWVVHLMIGAIVFVAWAPAASGWMLRIGPAVLPWVDQHMAGVFSSADMLASGYRLFADIPIGYGILIQGVLAAARKGGCGLTLGGLIHLTEVFQVTALCLFVLAAWVRTGAAGSSGRAVAVLLVVLVTAPFLAMANPAVLFTNQSGLRFVMLPVAVLAANALDRWQLAASSALVGAIAALALLHNPETGIVVLASLGLGWLVRARLATVFEGAAGLLSGIAAVVAVLGLATLAHLALFGHWPTIFGSGNTASLAQRFAAGYGGFALHLRVVALVMMIYAGSVVVRALASILGRRGNRPDAASTVIAGLMIAWAPYYVNRPNDWNLWSFLALFAVLLAPAVARMRARSGGLAVIAALLLVPVPLATTRSDAEWFHGAAKMSVQANCADGLSFAPAECALQRARATELARIAAPNDVIWMTVFPYLTLHLSGLRSPIATLDSFSAARTEADLDAVVNEIWSSHPIALLLDGTGSSSTGLMIPPPMRSVVTRIADRAGFAPCALVALQYWQLWLPKDACHNGDWRVAALAAR